MNTERYYNASKWQKQLLHIVRATMSFCYFAIDVILSIVGLLFCFNGLMWQWYQVKVCFPITHFFYRPLDKIYKKLGCGEV